MRDRILFIPDTWVSPRGCELIPAFKTMLDDWRVSYEVEVFAWPWMRGQGRAGGPNADLERYDARSAHVVAAPIGSWLVIAHMQRHLQPRSFTSIGFFPPPATLKAFGAEAVLNEAAVSIFSGVGSTVQFLRLWMPDSEDLTKIARELDKDMELDKEAEAGVAGFRELDLSKRPAVTSLPVLYLKLIEDPMAESLDHYEIFKSMFPEARSEQLTVFPDYSKPEGGREVSRIVAAFIERVTSDQNARVVNGS